MKLFLSVAALLLAVSIGNAQVVVIDPTAIARRRRTKRSTWRSMSRWSGIN